MCHPVFGPTCSSGPQPRLGFEYSVLGWDEIRLLNLYPADDDKATIRCSIEITLLSKERREIVKHYTALSYVWGDAHSTKTILVEDTPVEVMANLYSALLHLRERGETRVLRLWIDAICINQADTEERNQQVQQMGEIYATAHHTVIYLGDYEHVSCYSVFEAIQLLMDRDSSQHGTPSSDIDCADLLHVLERPWFTRVWVLQELVLSRNPWLQLGKVRLEWDTFSEIASKLFSEFSGEFNASQSEFLRIASIYVVKTNTAAAAQAKDQFMRMIDIRDKHLRKGSKRGATMELAELVRARRGMGVSDARDMLYGHVGLACGTYRVDYTISAAQVFTGFARDLLSSGNFVLDRIADKSVSSSGIPDLPSWVPDWTQPKTMSSLYDTCRLFDQEDGFFDPNPILPPVESPSKDPRTITCLVEMVGKVVLVGNVVFGDLGVIPYPDLWAHHVRFLEEVLYTEFTSWEWKDAAYNYQDGAFPPKIDFIITDWLQHIGFSSALQKTAENMSVFKLITKAIADEWITLLLRLGLESTTGLDNFVNDMRKLSVPKSRVHPWTMLNLVKAIYPWRSNSFPWPVKGESLANNTNPFQGRKYCIVIPVSPKEAAFPCKERWNAAQLVLTSPSTQVGDEICLLRSQPSHSRSQQVVFRMLQNDSVEDGAAKDSGSDDTRDIVRKHCVFVSECLTRIFFSGTWMDGSSATEFVIH